MSVGTTVLKIIIAIFNTLVALLGLACIVVGALAIRSDNLDEISNRIKTGDLFNGAYLILVVGVIIFIVAMIGCCGAIMSSKCLLMTYFIIVTVVVIVELAGAGIAWKNASTFDKALKDTLKDEFQHYNNNTSTRKFFNYIQKNLKCCGITSSSDYTTSKTPPSCIDKDTAKPYTDGCVSKVETFLKKIANAVGGLALALTIAQIITLVLVLWLFCTLRKAADVA